MLNLGTAAAKITLDISNLTSNANKANATINGIGAGGAKNLDTLQGKISTYGASIQKVSTVVAGFGLAVTGAFGIAAKGAIGFDSAMGNVNSIAQLTKGQLSDLTNQVLDLSKATGQAPTTLADGLYDIESSGFKSTDALTILTAAANAANAGLSDTGTSAAVITAVLNSYGLSADQAGHASDVLFQTVNDGVVTFGQLSQYMGQTLPIASALNVPIEQLGASYALMTKNGLPIAETQTDINALLTAALNPTTALTAAVQAHGYASAEDLIKTKGLSGYLDVLSDASGGSATALTELLGTQNASAAAMLLMKDGGKQYTDELTKMNDASKGLGATQTALNKQQDTTAFKLKLLAAAFSVLEIRIGQQLEPAINTVAEGLTKLFNVISGLPTPVLAAIAAIGGVVGVVALVAGSIGLVLPKILEMKAAFGEVFALMRGGAAVEGAASSFSLLSPPILLVTAAIVGLGIAYKTNFLGFADGVKAAGSDLTDTWDGLTGGISNFIDNFGLAYDAMAPVKGVVGGISAGFKDLQPPVHAVGDAVGKVAGFLKGFNGAADSTKKSLDGVTGPAKSVGDAVNGLANGINGVTDAVNPFNVGVGSATKHIQALYGTATGLARVLLALSYAFGQIGGGKFAWANDISAGLLKAAKYTQLFQNYFKAAFGGNTMSLLKGLPKPIQSIARGFGQIALGLGNLQRAYKANGFLGVIKALPGFVNNLGFAFSLTFLGIGQAFSKLAMKFPIFKKTLTDIGQDFALVGHLGEDFASLISHVMRGDFSGALGDAKKSLSDFGTLGKFVFKTVTDSLGELGKVGLSLGDWVLTTVAPKVVGWIADHAGDVWDAVTGIAGWVWSGVEDLGELALKITKISFFTLLNLNDEFHTWWNKNDGQGGVIGKFIANIESLPVTIKDWAISAAKDLGTAIGSWITGTALPALKGFVQDVGTIAVTISKWAVIAGVSIYDAAKTTVSAAIKAIEGLPWGEIKSVIVNIAGWLVMAGSSLFDAAKTVVSASISAIEGLPWGTIDSVLVNIGGWLVSAGASLYDAAKTTVSAAISAIEGLPWGEIGSAIVNIGGWLISSGASLLDAVKTTASNAIGLIQNIPFGSIANAVVNVTSWALKGVAIAAGDVQTAADSAYNDYVASGVAPAKVGPIPLTTQFVVQPDGSTKAVDPNSGGWQQVYANAFRDTFVIGQKIVDAVNRGIDAFGAGVTGGTGGFSSSWFALGAEVIGAGAVALAGGIDAGFTVISNAMRSIPTHIYDAIVKPLSDGLVSAEDALARLEVEAGGKMGEGLMNMFGPDSPVGRGIGAAWDGLSGLWDKGVSGFKKDIVDVDWGGVGSDMLDAGKEVIGKFWDGAKAAWDTGIGWLTGAVDLIPDSIKNLLGIGGGSGGGGGAKSGAGQIGKGLSGGLALGAANMAWEANQNGGPKPAPGGGSGGGSKMPNLGGSNEQIAAMLANLSEMPSVANNATAGLQNLATSGIAAVTGQAVGATAATGATSSALGALDAVKAMPKIDLDKTKLDAGIADAKHYNGMTLATAIVSIVAKQAGQGVVAGAKGAAASAIAAAGNATVSTTTTNTVTTRFDAIDNASKIIALVASGITHVPTSWATALRQAGAEAVTGAAGVTQGALESIPVSWFTGISQSGAETVTRSAGFTQGALEDIPTSWFTGISQSGAEGVAGSAYDASGAISSIPTSWYSTIGASVSGVGDVLALADAINAVHSVTVYVNAITSSGLSAVGNAKGGYTKGVPGWLAEQGPELLRFPDGSMGLAREKALYSVPAGTFVFTAPKTANMLDGAGPIPGYARGGYVRPWRAAAPTSVPTRSAARGSQTTYITHVYAVKSDELVELIDNAQAGGDLARNLGPMITQIRQTASTPTVGRR